MYIHNLYVEIHKYIHLYLHVHIHKQQNKGNVTKRQMQLVGFSNYRSLVQNTVSFIGLFCKRDL